MILFQMLWVMMTSYIPVEGTTVWFSCPPGLVVNGPDSATCMENGEWEPDPSGVMCTDSKGKNTFLFSTLLVLLKSIAIAQ